MENTNVFISDLPADIDDEKLKSVFEAYGTVTWSKVMSSKGKPSQAAIVEFGDVAEARWVVENLNGNIAEGLRDPISVNFKRERQDKGKGKSSGGYGKADGKGWAGGGKGWSPYESGKGGGQVCRNFQQWGECKFGDSCKFSH
mmetsp:Transcript_43106/g.124528  ORF Transcript_43106/g.124528 Transcript_43106/m.124528 type:complete len:143 (-) Transcript_43106:227-655(-)